MGAFEDSADTELRALGEQLEPIAAEIQRLNQAIREIPEKVARQGPAYPEELKAVPGDLDLGFPHPTHTESIPAGFYSYEQLRQFWHLRRNPAAKARYDAMLAAFERFRAVEEQLFAELGYDGLASRSEQALSRAEPIAEAIARLQATTLAGIRVKALALQACCYPEILSWDFSRKGLDTFLFTGIARDILTMRETL